MDLSLNLKSLVAQQLIPAMDGKARQAFLDVMLNTPLVADLIRKGEVSELKELMYKSTEVVMQNFDQASFALYDAGEISYQDALAYADSINDLRLLIKLESESDYLSLASNKLELEDQKPAPTGFFRQ